MIRGTIAAVLVAVVVGAALYLALSGGRPAEAGRIARGRAVTAVFAATGLLAVVEFL